MIFSSAAGDGIALQDPDAGPLDPIWKLTLSVASGTLTLVRYFGPDRLGQWHRNVIVPRLAFGPQRRARWLDFHAAGVRSCHQNDHLECRVRRRPVAQSRVVVREGIFPVTSTADSGPGSLRQAILDSDFTPGGRNAINFAIPGQGVQTISPLSALPAISQSVLIDGFSQPGYTGTPLIELSGSQAGGGDGLTITGSNVTVRGLDINSFSQGAGILITGSGATGNVVAASEIGTDTTGSQALPNGVGIKILDGASNNVLGGTDAAVGNLIAFNSGPGVDVEGNSSVGNQITANRIFANTGQAIDLGGDGITYNTSYTRQGPNNFENFPVVITTAAGGLAGWLDGVTPHTTYRIDLFAGAGYTASGAGEAEDYLGSTRGDHRRQRPGFLPGSLSYAGQQTRDHGHRHRSPGRHLRSLGPASGDPRGPYAERPAGPRSNGDLLLRDRLWHRLARSPCGAPRSDLGPDAVGRDRDTPTLGDRGIDRLRRRNRLAVLSGSALGAERGLGRNGLHAPRGISRLRDAGHLGPVGVARLRSSLSS